MLIEGNLKTNKTQILKEKYLELLENGVNTSEILVICLNLYKKQDFIESIKQNTKEESLEQFNIHTFYGLAYNALLDNWPVIENQINSGDTRIIPNLCGLEVSQYILKNCFKTDVFKDYGSKLNLLHQLFRRYSLIVQNSLSDKEVKKRSEILKESFKDDAKKTIDLYKLSTLEYRSFDYLRQMAVFSYIYKNTDYFKEIKYLFIDDADEITYIILDFVKTLAPQLKEAFIAYDRDGASRCGYLSAYKTGVYEFEKLFNEKKVRLEEKSLISEEADKLFNNIISDKKTSSKSISFFEKSKRLELIDSVSDRINQLIKSGAKPSDILIISPTIDNLLKFSLKESLNSLNLKHQFISGSEKLCENKLIKASIAILKLSHPEWNLKVDSFEIRGIFTDLLNIPAKYCLKIIEHFKNNESLAPIEFENEAYNLSYLSLLELIKKIKESNLSLSKELLTIYEKFVCKNASVNDLNKFSFLIKEAQDFETAFGKNNDKIKKDFIIQIENSVISENPYNATLLEENAIMVATPQKTIDLELKTKYQIWLDASNNEWLKQDIGPLYNAWVFHADWDKETFTYEDNLRLTKEKIARILRKLMLCCDKEISAYSSLYDSNGNENFGGILDFFDLSDGTALSKKEKKKIIPREDQKAVLNYKKGKMGVMAVPGAGKTTILLALIIQFFERGILAENIFVLTYMESAARNLKERITATYPQCLELPNISTIHGLALRIIKENSNYSKLNLTDSFEICDDNEKQKIIREALLRLNIDQENYENYEKGISAIKLSAGEFNLKSRHKEINDFIRFFKEYNKILRENNLIDYDDMLDLAVKLLEKNPDILEYYQNLCKYIIEDEAQDSSSLQQKLLGLLAGKHRNLIRCGDVNQSITGTFTNSDLKEFIKYLKENTLVEMNSSQRCSEPVYSLANRLIEYSQKSETLKNAFYPIKMIPTESNPTTKKQPEFKIFEDEDEEKNHILKQIKTTLQQSPNSSIAILLRNNYQVNDFNAFLTKNGLKTITRTDFLGEKSVFKVIFSIIKLIQNPWNNKNLLKTMNTLQETKIINFSQADFKFVEDLKTPFVSIYCDEIQSQNLSQLYWDVNYWVNQANLPLDDMAIKIGLHYLKTDIEKSNTYLISTLIKRLASTYKNTETIIEKLEEVSKRPILSKYKFFTDEEKINKDDDGKVNIMTVHKSKGDEFDTVFIPELTEDSYSTDINKVKIKSNNHFMETIKSLEINYQKKDTAQLKKEQIEENLRLLYVAITRAKKELFLSSAKSYKKKKNNAPSALFKNFLEVEYE